MMESNARHFSLLLAALVAVTLVPARAQNSPSRLQDNSGQGPDNPARSFWNHNGSTMYLVASGATRQFYYEEPRPGMLAAGAQKGSLLFTGQYASGRYSGTAFIYDARCGKIPYEVSGPVLDNFETVQLTGRAPRMGSDCAIRGYVSDTLQFTLLKPGQRPQAGAALPADFAGTWIEAGKEKNACRADDWGQKGSGERDYEFITRLVRVTPNDFTGWELQCKPISVKRAEPWSAEQPSVETQMSCFGGALSWQATVLWTIRTIDNRRHLSVTTLRTTNTRDDGGQPIANSNSPVNAEFLECR